MNAAELDILLEDGPLLAVNKPSGIITQGAPRGVEGLVELAKRYLKQKYDKPGNVYLGIPHRLDRPTSTTSSGGPEKKPPTMRDRPPRSSGMRSRQSGWTSPESPSITVAFSAERTPGVRDL